MNVRQDSLGFGFEWQEHVTALQGAILGMGCWLSRRTVAS